MGALGAARWNNEKWSKIFRLAGVGLLNIFLFQRKLRLVEAKQDLRQVTCYSQFSRRFDFGRLARRGVFPRSLCCFGLDVNTLLEKVEEVEKRELKVVQEPLLRAFTTTSSDSDQIEVEHRKRFTEVCQRFQEIKKQIIESYNRAMIDWICARFKAKNPNDPLPNREEIFSGKGAWTEKLGLHDGLLRNE